MSELILNGINLNTEKENQSNMVAVTNNEIAAFTKDYKEKLRNDVYVQSLTSKINVTDSQSIVMFGQETSENINQISDRLLNSIKAVNQEEAGEILVQLTKVMDKFDIKDMDRLKEPNAIQKLFNRVKNSVDAILSKYDSMSTEVDKIFMILKRYETDITRENTQLSELYKANVNYYQELEKYIVAGELVIEELDTKHIPYYENLAQNSNDNMVMQDLNTLKLCRDMMDKRVYDLKLAENVALQSLPMIQQMQVSNFNLISIIKSSFITTLPIFKQCLIQAVVLKRQELMAKNIDAVRKTTNELLMRNAQNTARQSVEITKMSGQGVVDMETLKQSYSTIMQGIEETKKVQLQNRADRDKGSLALEEMKYKALTNKVN